MNNSSRREIITQERVIKMFCAPVDKGGLGYRYLGNWQHRANNRNIESEYLRANLTKRGYADAQINAAIQQFEKSADATGLTLYQSNLQTYQRLRYDTKVKVKISGDYESVYLIDWENPENNDFALAEEVTLKHGGYQRRPDIVLYINGIAIVVIELKRGAVEVGDGIRQLLTNQEEIFNKAFFSTTQLLLAGNDIQGLRYGTTETPAQFYQSWKEEGLAAASKEEQTRPGALLDPVLAQMCNQTRLLDLIRNFVVFDYGTKKVPRPHQYFAVKAAQARIKQNEGGVIWHTQGSGKSILMVLLTKWLLDSDPTARVLIITDRDELDKQIVGVMKKTDVIGEDDANTHITSRADFVNKLESFSPRLLCALIHKFEVKDFDGPPPAVKGRFFVFVDECHRSQGGEMNRQMKRWLESAIFIGFTGTPLLRQDKKMTRDVFGTYIHTYKFHQGVKDKVILDLKYEARDVPQQLTSEHEIDKWFEYKTRGLNNYQQAVLRKRWATLQKLMSAKDRKERIVASIITDFGLIPRLEEQRGTALLVADSIYEACHYFQLFQNHAFGKFCGIITSYVPDHNLISREPENGDQRFKFNVYNELVLRKGQTTKQYEDEAKRLFIEEPARMKLLIVVSKLLTGFDAPSCTYIYLDKTLRDHNLFQAICRTNRLDTPDKEYGHIVDFQQLFDKVEEAIAVYSSDELDTEDGSAGDNNITLKNWLEEGRRKLDEAREALHYLCEPVPAPREEEQFVYYFCGLNADPAELNRTEPLRISFYKAVATFLRAYGAVLQDLAEAGYSEAEVAQLRTEVVHFSEIRQSIKHFTHEELDTKLYEADMRHLLNTYIRADSARKIGELDEVPLTELIIESGIHDAIARKLNGRGKLSNNAVAEGIINNIRKTIIRDQLTDPRFYEQMSVLLADLIKQRREDAAAFEAWLQQAEELVRRAVDKSSDEEIPARLQGKPEAIVVYNNLPKILALKAPPADQLMEQPADYGVGNADLALRIDTVMREQAPASWRGDQAREAQVMNALYPLVGSNPDALLALFDLVKNQAGY